jgi:5-methyltetrahydrofolate--homocysteine methyltransferase
MPDYASFDPKQALNELKSDEVLGWVRDRLEHQTPPLEILDQLSEGLKELGDRFASGECFIPELIMGGNIFLQAVDLAQPAMEAAKAELAKIGTVVMGTVKGDLHDLGKNLVGITLMTAGFEVVDLGKDVPPQRFVEETKRLNPDVIGLSALLTTTLEQQRVVIEALEAAGLRDQVKVIVGGAPVNQGWADRIGADAYGADAIDGLRKAKEMITRN